MSTPASTTTTTMAMILNMGVSPLMSTGCVSGSAVQFAVDHPRRAVAVGEHGEAGRPEGGLQGHDHRAVLRQCLVQALRFGHFLHRKRDAEALDLVRLAGHFV